MLKEVKDAELPKRTRSLFLLHAILFALLSMAMLLVPGSSLQALGWDVGGKPSMRWLGGALATLAYLCLSMCKNRIWSPQAITATMLIMFSIVSVFVLMMAVLEEGSTARGSSVALMMLFLGLTLVSFYLKVSADSSSQLAQLRNVHEDYRRQLHRQEDLTAPLMDDEDEELGSQAPRETHNPRGEPVYSDSCDACARRKELERPLRRKLKLLKRIQSESEEERRRGDAYGLLNDCF